jgi:hypothetical protein
MTVAQLPTVEGEKPERDELLFFAPSSVSDYGGAAILGGAAGDKAE